MDAQMPFRGLAPPSEPDVFLLRDKLSRFFLFLWGVFGTLTISGI